MRKIFTLLIVAILATATSWAATTGTIKFGTNDVKIDKASVTAADDQGNSWEITTVGTTSFTQQPTYSQVGSSSKPATSITFTTTLPKGVKVTSLSAKFGGFNGTAGTIKTFCRLNRSWHRKLKCNERCYSDFYFRGIWHSTYRNSNKHCKRREVLQHFIHLRRRIRQNSYTALLVCSNCNRRLSK